MNKEALIEKMRPRVRELAELSSEAWNDFIDIFAPVELEKRQHLFLPGQGNSSSLYYVCSGLLRFYFISEDGKEWSKGFVPEDTLTASFSEDFLGYPSPYGIQVLENSILLRARFSDYRTLCDKHRSIERFGRRFIEQILAMKLTRERSFLQFDATSRYLDFVEQNPGLVERIPQYHLASYLGVSEVGLSRIRGQLESAIVSS